MSEKIGALWLKQNKNGKKYLSGVLEMNGEKVKIVVFKNTYKKDDKHPDYIIKRSESKSKETQEENPL